MHISEFDYELPEHLIAQHPLAERDASRMLVLNRRNQSWSDSSFASLPSFINRGDVVVINNTRVFPARLMAQRHPTGGRVEILLVRHLEAGVWEALLKPGNRLAAGAQLMFSDSDLKASVLDDPGTDVRLVEFNSPVALEHVLRSSGQLPLPPYIKRAHGSDVEDAERYQTIYARERGAIAAPTAGLHFTPKVIDAIMQAGASVVEITLHVGYGTFEPVRVDVVEEHSVKSEQFVISNSAAETINAARRQGGRVIAVGTTTTRALEAATDEGGTISAMTSEASLTITPGYRFKAVQALLTNFHLPKSSLLLLVAAFAGREFVLNAYAHAVAEQYRFYSYGDCMLII